MNPLMTFSEFRALRIRWHMYFLPEPATAQDTEAFHVNMEKEIEAEWTSWRESLSPFRRKMRDLAWQHVHADSKDWT